MWILLQWLYISNATLLVVHEMDSAYFKEWEMFRLPGGLPFFLILHLPLVALMFFGMTLVAAQDAVGLWFAVVLAGAGIFAFILHITFLFRGHPAFRNATSISLLTVTLLVSIAKMVCAIMLIN